MTRSLRSGVPFIIILRLRAFTACITSLILLFSSLVREHLETLLKVPLARLTWSNVTHKFVPPLYGIDAKVRPRLGSRVFLECGF